MCSYLRHSSRTKGSLRIDVLLAQVPQVEIHHRAVRSLHGAPFSCSLNERLRQAIARAQLHAAQDRLWFRRAQVVVLQVSIAVFVE